MDTVLQKKRPKLDFRRLRQTKPGGGYRRTARVYAKIRSGDRMNQTPTVVDWNRFEFSSSLKFIIEAIAVSGPS